MGSWIDENVRRNVIWEWLLGHRLEDIASKNKISYGSVRNIIDELRQGRYPEYREYVPYLDDLRWLSQQLTSRHRTLAEAIAGTLLLDGLLKLGIDPVELPQLLGVLRKLLPPGFPRDAFVKTALQIITLERETGLDFIELGKKLSGLQSEIAGLEKTKEGLTSSIDSLRSQERKANQNLNQTLNDGKVKIQQLEQSRSGQLASNKLTDDKLAQYLQIQSKLTSYGIDFDKLDALVKVLDEFERHGMQANTIVEYVASINSLSQQKHSLSREVEIVQKELSDKKKSVEVLNTEIATKETERNNLENLKTESLAELDRIKKERDQLSLPIDAAKTLFQLLKDPSRVRDQQLLNMSKTLEDLVKSRKTTPDLLVDYDRVRQMGTLLVGNALGKTLVFKDVQESEMTALRDMNRDLQFNTLRKLRGDREALRRERFDLDVQKRALGEAAEDKVLEVAAAQVKKGVFFIGKCKNCRAKGLVIPGNGRPHFLYNCPCCPLSLDPMRDTMLTS